MSCLFNQGRPYASLIRFIMPLCLCTIATKLGKPFFAVILSFILFSLCKSPGTPPLTILGFDKGFHGRTMGKSSFKAFSLLFRKVIMINRPL